MTHFYLLRHGETEWNAAGNRYCGRTDVPLADRGRVQAAAAAQALLDVEPAAVICSPLRRSVETADLIAVQHHLQTRIESRLTEIDFGQWEGKTRSEIEDDDPEGWRAWAADPARATAGLTGESGQAVVARMTALVEDLAAEFRDRTVILIGHNTLNRLWIMASLGAPLANYRQVAQSNAGISRFEPGPDGIRWLQLNNDDHLR